MCIHPLALLLASFSFVLYLLLFLSRNVLIGADVTQEAPRMVTVMQTKREKVIKKYIGEHGYHGTPSPPPSPVFSCIVRASLWLADWISHAFLCVRTVIDEYYETITVPVQVPIAELRSINIASEGSFTPAKAELKLPAPIWSRYVLLSTPFSPSVHIFTMSWRPLCVMPCYVVSCGVRVSGLCHFL